MGNCLLYELSPDNWVTRGSLPEIKAYKALWNSKNEIHNKSRWQHYYWSDPEKRKDVGLNAVFKSVFTISDFSEQYMITLDWQPNKISQQNALSLLRDLSMRIKSPLKQLL